MILTKKRILALITAFLLLISAAILPIGQNINLFGTIKASAANIDGTVIEALKDLAGDGVKTITMSSGQYSPGTVDGTEITGTVSETGGTGTFTHTSTGTVFALTGCSFEGSTYTVTFGAITTYPVATITAYDGVTQIQQQSTSSTNGKLTSAITDPTKEGYTFNTWYFLSDLTGSTATSEGISDGTHYSDFSIYADWTIKTNTVTFGTNVTASGTTAGSITSNSTQVQYGDTVTVTANDKDTCDAAKKFKNWTASTGATVTPTGALTGTFSMPDAAVTITPTYETFYTTTFGTTTTEYFAGDNITLSTSVPSDKNFTGWTVVKTTDSTPVTVTNATSATGASFAMPAYDVTVTASFTDKPASGGVSSGGSSRRPSSSSSSSSTPAPTTTPPTTPAASTPTTSTTADGITTAPAADVKADAEISAEGTVGVTIGNTTIETSSTAAAVAIVGGTAAQVVTSGSAVAVVTKDNEVIAGANATGSLNSASTVAALKAAAASLEKGDTDVTIKTGTDVSAISASTLQKLAAAAENAGVEAKISATAADETGAAVATLDIPVTATANTSIKTGIILEDTSIDSAVASLEKATGNTVLASFKTEQKTSFGAKTTFAFSTNALGLETVKDGSTLYIAIKLSDGKTVQIKGTVTDGVLSFTTSRAGTFMISDKSFIK